jgi:hypothetical protein
VQLKRAPYGHPGSGTPWEQHAGERIRAAGFFPVCNWQSCYVHPRLRLLLIAYVDDLMPAGPKGNLAEGWRLIRRDLELEDPTPLGLFLGCKHEKAEWFDRTLKCAVRGLSYNQ